jgi:hypothetical protein
MSFNFDNITLIVAIWGAFTGTFAVFLEVYKWLRKGPQIKSYVLTNRRIVGSPYAPKEIFCQINVTNVGDQATTIQGVYLKYYSSIFNYLRHKYREAYLVPCVRQSPSPLPYLLEPGAQWFGLFEQEKKIETMAKAGKLVCEVYDSWHRKPTKSVMDFKYYSIE